jgi:osmotically-inducible protein OsmY
MHFAPPISCDEKSTLLLFFSDSEGNPLQAQADVLLPVHPVSIAASSAVADRELKRRICIFLENRQLPHSSKLRIDAQNGVVTLHGTHRSFYHKQLCINCCQRVAGVVRLIDATRVLPER